MKKKKIIIICGIAIAIIGVVIGMLMQSPNWSQRSFEAVVKETVTQSDGEVRLIVERTTEIYGDPLNSLGISTDTQSVLLSDSI